MFSFTVKNSPRKHFGPPGRIVIQSYEYIFAPLKVHMKTPSCLLQFCFAHVRVLLLTLDAHAHKFNDS